MLTQTATEVTNQAVLATAQAAGTNSPSRKTIPIGEDIARGLQVGMANQQDEVAASGQALGSAAVGGTQSGGGRARRGASRPQGAPGAIGLSGTANSAVSPAMKDVIDTEVKARKTSAQRIDSMNKGLMAGTFALTSLAGAGSMASGPLGDLSQHVMKFSGLLFALMSVTQLLTQAKFAELVATRAKTVADLMGSKTVGGLFSKGGGLVGFGKNLLTASKFILRFAGPIGLLTTAIIGTISVIKMVNAARERERIAIEGLADAMTTTTTQVKTLGDFFNVLPAKLPFELGQREIVKQETRTQRESLKADPGFQKEFKSTIEALRKATNDEAKIVFSSLALNLKAQGFASDQVQVIIDALREESSQTDVVLDVKSLTLSKESLDQLKKDIAPLLLNLDKALDAGMTKTFVGGKYNVPLQEVITLSKDAQKQLETTSEFMSEAAKSASGMFELGLIDGKAYEATLGTILALTDGLDEAQRKLLLSKVFEKLGVSVNKYTDALFTARQEMQLLAVLSAGVLTKDSPILKALASTDYKTQMRGVNGLNKLYDQMFSSLEKIKEEQDKVNGSTPGTGGEKSAFQLAIEQLQKQQLELKNTKIAYDMLKKAGFDAATATKYAGDSVIALGLATGKISTKQIEQVATLMTDIEKRAGSEAIRNFLDSLGTENKLKQNLLGIVPTLLAMGATTKDIENILGNSELTKSFVDPLATAEQKAARIKEYLDAVRRGEKIDIEFNLIINPDEAKQELKRKADELFGFLERAAQREYKPKILDAEKEVKNAQEAVDAVQAEIESIQKGIEKEQRNIELQITRPIEDFQETINDLQRTIELDFERPLAALSDESSLLSEELVVIDKIAESINSKYDAQAEALNKVSEINSDIINQQKQQLGLADALTQGDISAAASAAQEMRASQAEASVKNAGDIIQAARDAEISGLRSSTSGLTRKQIEDRQYQIERQTFDLNLRRKAIDQDILDIQDKIYLLEEDREKRVRAIRIEEDKIYEITNNKLVTAQKQLESAQKNLDKLKEELQARLDAIDAQRDAWEAAADAEMAAAITAGKYNDVIEATLKLLQDIEQKWRDIALAAASASGQLGLNDAYIAPSSSAADDASLNSLISAAQAVDAAQAAADAAAEAFDLASNSGEWWRFNELLQKKAAADLKLKDALGEYDRVTGANATSSASGSGGGAFSMQYMSKGGMVPKYMAAGGFAKGTDTVPAMLTPGEFVMNKNATKKFGPLLSSLNKGQYPGAMSQGKFGISSNSQSFISPSYSVASPTTISSPSTNVAAPSYNNNSNTVYNYSVGINVGGSNVNPDSIAKAVLGEIRYIDSQRIRGQR
jgi:hypothetical protein